MKKAKKKVSLERKRLFYPYLFISPFYILFAIFLIYPVAMSARLSLFRKMGLGEGSFIGISNYLRLVKDNIFWLSLRNTAYYALGTLLIQLPLALCLALIVNWGILRFKSFFRVSFFLPVITSTVVISIIFRTTLDYRYGFLNIVLKKLGIPQVPWLIDSNVIMSSIIMVGIWRWAGWNMLYFLAGLQSIPGELYEASRLDGANRRQCFWYVTLPLLKPMAIFVLITHTIGALQLFDLPFLLPEIRGGPGNASISMVLYVYKNAFDFFNFGYGTAVAYALFVIIILISVIQLKLLGFMKKE